MRTQKVVIYDYNVSLSTSTFIRLRSGSRRRRAGAQPPCRVAGPLSAIKPSTHRFLNRYHSERHALLLS